MAVFLFTDMENSTRLWEKYPAQMGQVLARHDAILQREIARHGGRIFKHTGDGILAVFEGGRPLHCALEVQKALAREDWTPVGEVSVRLALHAGEALRRGGDYFGPTLNRTARLLSSGWGGQVLFTPEVLREASLPEGASWRDLGYHFFKDLGTPQQVYELCHPDLAGRDFPPLRSLSAHRHNLPVQPTPFIGREQELSRLLALLEEPACRLLSVVGPGGVGKTRLALQAAAEKVESFPDGVYFTPLAALTGPEFLPSAIAAALDFSFYGSEEPLVQLTRYLQGKHLLLILDNFEHLVAGAGLLAELLQATAELKVLVTSREPVHLHGEWVFSLEGMEQPQDDREEIEGNEAVQLFLQGARRARPDFALGMEERPAVAHICRLVGGLPLGIELASAWVRMLSCREIAHEIERGLDFLSASWRDLPERQRSLRAVFDYSWRLLAEEERRALAYLSVFRGGFRREAAEQVAGAGLPVLSALLDKSLLRQTAGRHEMLEVVRQYAAEKLEEIGEGAKRRARHGQFYLSFLAERQDWLKGGRGKEALEEIQGEVDNVREAWRWAVAEGRWAEIGRAMESLGLFYEMRSLFQEGEEAFRRAEEALRRAGGPAALLGRVLARRGWYCTRLSRYREAGLLFEEGLTLLRRCGDDPEGIAFSLRYLSHVRHCLGEHDVARQLLEESLQIGRQIGNLWQIAHTLNGLGVVANVQGEHDQARRFHEEGLDIFRRIGDRRGIAATLNNLGVVASVLEDYQEAARLYRESLDIYRELGDRRGIAFALANLGYISAEMGEFAEAERLSGESLAIFREIGERWGAAYALNNLGTVAWALGRWAAAWQYHREALQTAAEVESFPRMLEALVGMARLLVQEGQLEQSVELLAAVLNHPARDRQIQKRAERLLERLRQEVPPDVLAAAVERGRSRPWAAVCRQVGL